eukprot:3575637-Prymnesium_polylepis.1
MGSRARFTPGTARGLERLGWRRARGSATPSRARAAGRAPRAEKGTGAPLKRRRAGRAKKKREGAWRLELVL